MLTEERVREIARHESDNGEGCMIAVFFIILFFIAIEVLICMERLSIIA